MRVGERCRLLVDPEYGYGDRGSFSFPSVPPKAQLEYDLELVSCSPPEDKPRSEMFFEERLEAAQRQRKRANDLFASGQTQDAIAGYDTALSFVDEDFTIQLEDIFLEQANAVIVPVHLNLAACHLKLEDWNKAEREASMVLSQQLQATSDQRSKAFYRRGRARAQLRRTEEAIRDLMSALVLCPNDTGITRELTRLKRQLQAEEKATASLFKDKFKPQPGSKSSNDTSDEAADDNAIWNSTMDDLSIGERTFNWLADKLIDLLEPLWLWMKWKPRYFQRVPATSAAAECTPAQST